MRSQFTLYCMLLLSLATCASAAVPPVRLARLAKGVNLSHWYAQWRKDYSENRLSTYFDASDVDLVVKMGFTHVRLTIDSVNVFDPNTPGKVNEAKLPALLQRIDRFVAAKLAVIVDLHPEPDYKKALSDAAHQDKFVADWGALAKALRGTDPNWVYIEVMNEPETLTGDAWRNLQGKAVQAIRENLPDHTLIVSAGGWTAVASLPKFEPYTDANLIYTFHHYEPFLFSHQQAEWGWKLAKDIKALNWPIEPASAEEVSVACTTSEEAKKTLFWQIKNGQFSRTWMVKQFDAVSQWQKSHGDLAVYMGEFGVYTKAAPAEARYNYYQACREEAELRHWGWAIWDYAGGFRVVSGEVGHRVADEKLLKALGLRH